MTTVHRFLAVGHVTWDFDAGSHEGDRRLPQPGGAVAFSAIVARRLGLDRVGIVTSCADDYPLGEVIDDRNRLVRIPARETTAFENRYARDGRREQILLGRAGDIRFEDVPDGWRSPDLLFVGPLTQELPKDCISWFSSAVTCVVPQGWLRSWESPLPSAVEVSDSPPDDMSGGWDICVVSEDEADTGAIDAWLNMARVLVVTKGADGADLYLDGSPSAVHIPSYGQALERVGFDTTGAGDVFATAMLIRYSQTGDTVGSARFASACAALSTMDLSWRAVPTTEEVEGVMGECRF